jgi:hypothetical protein
MDAYIDGLMNVIEKHRKSKAASAPVITTPCNFMVADNPNRIINGSKAASTQMLTRERRIPIPGSSSGELLYKCGVHDYETKNLMEFNEHLNMTHSDTNSKAASVLSINKVKAIHDFLKSDGRL